MDVLRRIDKGYFLVNKAKQKADKLMEIQDLKDIEEELAAMSEEEALLRNKIDQSKTELNEKEKYLSDIEKQLSSLLKSFYRPENRSGKKYEKLKNKELAILTDKEQTEEEIMRCFAGIDYYNRELNIFKQKYNTLERKSMKRRLCQQEKVVYIEDKVKSMEKKIRKLRKGIEPEILNYYDKKKQTLTKVFSAVVQDICSSCNHPVSKEGLRLLEDSSQIVECDFCGRILYMEEIETDYE